MTCVEHSSAGTFLPIPAATMKLWVALQASTHLSLPTKTIFLFQSLCFKLPAHGYGGAVYLRLLPTGLALGWPQENSEMEFLGSPEPGASTSPSSSGLWGNTAGHRFSTPGRGGLSPGKQAADGEGDSLAALPGHAIARDSTRRKSLWQNTFTQ